MNSVIIMHCCFHWGDLFLNVKSLLLFGSMRAFSRISLNFHRGLYLRNVNFFLSMDNILNRRILVHSSLLISMLTGALLVNVMVMVIFFLLILYIVMIVVCSILIQVLVIVDL